MVSIITTASAAPAGQLFIAPNIDCTRLPIIMLSGPPTMIGVMYSPMVGTNIMMKAATTPGSDRGKVMRQNRLAGPSPRSAAASR